MKVKCLLVGVVVLFAACVLTVPGYAKMDPKTIAGVWLFDEGKGDVAKDSSGNKNDGTLMNKPKWVDGKFGKAIEFDGTDDYVSVPDSATLDFSGALSMGFWMKANNVSGEQWLVSKGGGWARKGFFSTIGISNGLLRFGMGNGSVETVADNVGFKTGTWYHIVMTYDVKTMKVYSNGVLLPITKTNSYSYVNSYPVRMGGGDGNSLFPFNGSIDDVAIFNVALGEEDVQATMNQGLDKALGITAVYPTGKLATTWATIKAR